MDAVLFQSVSASCDVSCAVVSEIADNHNRMFDVVVALVNAVVSRRCVRATVYAWSLQNSLL